jgi:hypothetical protein
MRAVQRSGLACPATTTFLFVVISCLAQQPRLSNAKLQTRAVAAGIEQEFQSIAAAESGPAWIGYAVRALPGERHMCCSSSFEDGQGIGVAEVADWKVRAAPRP